MDKNYNIGEQGVDYNMKHMCTQMQSYTLVSSTNAKWLTIN